MSNGHRVTVTIPSHIWEQIQVFREEFFFSDAAAVNSLLARYFYEHREGIT